MVAVPSLLNNLQCMIDREASCLAILEHGSMTSPSLSFYNKKKEKTVIKGGGGDFLGFFLFMYDNQHCVSFAAPQTSLCWRMQGRNPGQFRLRQWLSDALTTRLDLIRNLDLIHCCVSAVFTINYMDNGHAV
jgi:hypothetical protein